MRGSRHSGGKTLRPYTQPILNRRSFPGSRHASRLTFKRRHWTLVAIVLSILVGLLLTLGSGFARKSRQSDVGQHVLWMPYYSIKGDWNSTLTLNNATHDALPVSVVLYSLEGLARPLSNVTLPANLSTTLRLDDLLGRSEKMGLFQEGSIELRFVGEPMDLGPQLTVSDLKHGLSFDMEPLMGLKSSSLEALWWSLDDKTDGRVMLSNTTAQNLAVQMNIDWHGRLIPAKPLSLAAHQTMVLGIADLLKQLDIKVSGIESGGISITHNGAPGALIAHGVVENKQGRFASNLRFIDPAAQKTAVLNGTGLMLAHSATGAGLRSSFFTPHLILRNASSSPLTATVTIQYAADGKSQAQILPPLALAPHELSKVDFSALLSSLRNTSVVDAGVKIEGTGSPGSLVAQMTSTDQNGATAVDVPLVAVKPGTVGTGAHPFRLEGDSEAVLHLKNLDRETTTAIVQILYDDGEFTPELVKLGPEEAVAVDLRRLRDTQSEDVHGHRLPHDFTQGQVQWFQHGKQTVMGRVVQSSPSLGVASNFGCGGLCCPPSFYSLNINPGSLDGIPEDTFDLTMTETDYTCGQFYGPFNVTEYVTCTSDDTAVAEAYGTTIEMEDEGLTNINVEYMATTFERGFTECESGPCEPNCIESDNLLTEFLQALVRIPHHLKVVSDTHSTICNDIVTRALTLQVVDRNGNNVRGVVPIKEKFVSITTNTCGNGNPVASGCSSTNATNGEFTDHIGVGCNSVGGSCGYDITKQYLWCPLRRAALPIGTYSGYTHSNAISVAGVVSPPDSMSAGTRIDP